MDKGKLSLGLPDWDRLLKEEKKRRLDICMNSKKCDREPKLYNCNYFDQKEITTILEKEENNSRVIEQDEMMRAMNILKESKNDKFVIRSRVEYEKLIKENVYTKTTIQFKFCNNLILIAHFGLQEKIKDVYDFINSSLKYTDNFDKIKVILKQGYPAKSFNEHDKTIFEEKLYPTATIYVQLLDGEKEIVPKLSEEKSNSLN